MPVSAQTRGRPVASSLSSLTELSNSLQHLSSRISPSVVQITATSYGLQPDSQHGGANLLSRERSTGSGVIVSSDGDIMTNAHVIAGARAIRVKVNGASERQNS